MHPIPFSSVSARAVAAAFALAGAFFAPSARAAVDACTQTTKLSGGTVYTKDGSGPISGGYDYELWHDGSGSMKMTVFNKDAAFKAEWSNAGDFLARVGLKWNSTQTHDKYGAIVADYNFTKTGSGGGYSFLGIYGWTKDPLVEYYIVEDWYGNSPPTGGGSFVSQFDVDGGTYKIYKFQRVNKPSIIGNTTFWQFFSVRQKARQCGHISISEHFKKWGSSGLNMGKMYESKILVEAGGGAGSFDLTYATMQTNYTTAIAPTPDQAPAISRSGASWMVGARGTLSLSTLDGRVLRSVPQEASQTAVVPTAGLPKGVYVLRFQEAGAAPVSRKFLLD